MLGARGEVTSTASGLPVRRRLSVRPVVSRPPGPARPCTPLRRVAAPRPGWPHHVSALPFAGTRKDLVSPFPGRCNCKPPGARGLYLSRNACPQGRCERSIWLPLENFCPLCKGIPPLQFLFFKLQARTAGGYKLQERAILFLRAFCLGAFAVLCKSSRLGAFLLQPLPASLVPPVRCGACHSSSEPLLSCSRPCKKSWRGSG